MQALRIRIIERAEEAMLHLELLQQLSPKLTQAIAFERLIDMFETGNYKLATAWENNKCVGLCGFWIVTKLYSGKYVELDNVVMHKDHRNKNIGEKLCNHVLEIARQEGCEMAMLDAYLENSAGHRFYQRLGFYPRGFHFLKRLN